MLNRANKFARDLRTRVYDAVVRHVQQVHLSIEKEINGLLLDKGVFGVEDATATSDYAGALLTSGLEKALEDVRQAKRRRR